MHVRACVRACACVEGIKGVDELKPKTQLKPCDMRKATQHFCHEWSHGTKHGRQEI